MLHCVYSYQEHNASIVHCMYLYSAVHNYIMIAGTASFT